MLCLQVARRLSEQRRPRRSGDVSWRTTRRSERQVHRPAPSSPISPPFRRTGRRWRSSTRRSSPTNDSSTRPDRSRRCCCLSRTGSPASSRPRAVSSSRSATAQCSTGLLSPTRSSRRSSRGSERWRRHSRRAAQPPRHGAHRVVRPARDRRRPQARALAATRGRSRGFARVLRSQGSDHDAQFARRVQRLERALDEKLIKFARYDDARSVLVLEDVDVATSNLAEVRHRALESRPQGGGSATPSLSSRLAWAPSRRSSCTRTDDGPTGTSASLSEAACVTDASGLM